MTALDKNARTVGFLYFLLALAGPVRLIYVPTKLFVHGDAAATAANILAHETLFRFGIAADLFGAVILVFLALAFYRLFKDVDHYQAVLLVITGGVLPSALYFVNTVNDVAALALVNGADYLTVFNEPQRYALARFFLDLHYNLIVGAEVLWGLWLFPMAMLTIKSGFLPAFLGWWLILNGLAYLALSYTGLFYPGYTDTLANYTFPVQLGEVVFMLWTLILGARPGFRARTVG